MIKMIESDDKTKYDTFSSNTEAETIINEKDIDDIFESIYTTIISNIQKCLEKGSGWIIDLVVDHNIDILKYNRIAGSSYTKLRKELDHSRKGLINIQNIDDNEHFNWCLVRCSHCADHNPASITKANKDFARKFDFEDTKFPVKIRNIHKWTKRILFPLVFLVIQKNAVKKDVDLLLIGEEGRRYYINHEKFQCYKHSVEGSSESLFAKILPVTETLSRLNLEI